MKKQNLAFLILLVILTFSVVLYSSGNKKGSIAGLTGASYFDRGEIQEPPSPFEPAILPFEKALYIVEFDEPAILGFSVQSDSIVSQVVSQHEQAMQDIGIILSGQEYGIMSEGGSSGFIIEDYKYVFNGMAVNATAFEAAAIESLPYVKGIFPSKTYHIDLNVSVPLIRADDVWLLQDENGNNVTGQNITIAVIDTGVDYTHSDLGGCTNETVLGGTCSKVIAGYNYFNKTYDPMDDNGHGTHVSATAAGNGTLKGVAPGAKIVSYKVCSSSGSCPNLYIIAAIENATFRNYSIISMSLGGAGTPDDALSTAADNAASAGVVVVASAGNNGPNEGTVGSPGNSRKTITVGASSKSDAIASFSSRGPTSIGTLKPDIVAPGVSICAAEWDSALSAYRCYDSQHIAISGTSMATPHVAGIAALILQMHKDWEPVDVKMAIRNTAVDIGLGLTSQGHGRVDALGAVNLTTTPCTAEFDTYNTTYIGGGNITFNGTANCSVFYNYSVYYGYTPYISPGAITQFYSGGNFLDEVSDSFSGNEVKQEQFLIPKNANISSAILRIKSFNYSGAFPYKVSIDLGGEGNFEWLSYRTNISQTQTGVESGYFYSLYSNRTIAQSFKWPGGEISAIGLMMQRITSGDGLILEIRNSTDNLPSELIANYTIPFEDVSSSRDWNSFLTVINLTNGTYWFVLKLATRDYGDYFLPYSFPGTNPYADGEMKTSDDYGQSWYYYIGSTDLAFKIYNFDYFYGEDTINSSLKSEINDFLKSCTPSIGANCTFPIVINSTNGTVNLSGLSVSYNGTFTGKPAVWEKICSSSSPVNYGTLCTWDSKNVSQQAYPVMLVVNGENSTSRDYLFKNVRQYSIVLPENGYLIKNGSNITISAEGSFVFQNYTLDYMNLDEGSWHTIKFSENVAGNGTLGYFNSTALQSGNYTIRLTAYIQGSSVANVNNVTVKVDKSLQDGWPQELDFTVFASVKVADLDGDGKNEVIATSSRSPYIFQTGGDYNSEERHIYVFSYNGSLMPGWPQPVNPLTWGKSISIGDLDNDRTLEIVSIGPATSEVLARHYNGSNVTGWPVSVGSEQIQTHPSLYDIDNDGYLEVIFASQYNVYVYRSNGTLMWKSPTGLVKSSTLLYPVVGDVNKDGYGEILIYARSSKKLFLFNHTGGVMDGWPYMLNNSGDYIYSALMADLDGDRTLEILFYQNGKGILAMHYNGSNVTGWPPAGTENYWITELIAADLNNDRQLEIIAVPFVYGGVSSHSNLYVYNSDGSAFSGFPVALPYNTIHFRPTVADIDGDSSYEILTAGQSYVYSGTTGYSEATVYAFDTGSHQVDSAFPWLGAVGAPFFQYARMQESAPAIADIDGDGDMEIIIGSSYYTDRKPLGSVSGGRVIIWDLNTTYNDSVVEWGQFGGNLYNTNSYVDVDFDKILFNDNCPFSYNPSQADDDNDTVGDACDSIVGNLTAVNTTIPNLTITIGGSDNLSGQFNETQEVQFYDNGTLFMNFTANFSSYSLRLYNMSIEKGLNGTSSYIIIRNLNVSGTKTIYLNRTNSSSNAVCFIDNETASLSDIAAGCTNLSCPGTSGSYSCSVSGNVFEVSGLSHSALIETYYSAPQPPSGGGTSGKTSGSTGGTGGGILVPPAEKEAGEEAEGSSPAEAVVPATKKAPAGEEIQPAVEKPEEIAAESRPNYAPYAIAFAVFAAVIAIAYFEIKKKHLKETGGNNPP